MQNFSNVWLKGLKLLNPLDGPKVIILSRRKCDFLRAKNQKYQVRTIKNWLTTIILHLDIEKHQERCPSTIKRMAKWRYRLQNPVFESDFRKFSFLGCNSSKMNEIENFFLIHFPEGICWWKKWLPVCSEDTTFLPLPLLNEGLGWLVQWIWLKITPITPIDQQNW